MRAAERGELGQMVLDGAASANAYPETGTYHLAVSQLIAELLRAPAQLSVGAKQGLLDAGIAHGILATTNTDQPMLAYYYLAELGMLAGEPRTETWIRRLIEIDPYWYRPHWLLAAVLIGQGKFPEALEHAEIADRLAPYIAPVRRLRDEARRLSKTNGDLP